MADVNANIGINIDASDALSQLKSLQRQISQFHTSIAKSSEAAALAQRSLQKNLLNSINSLSGFSAEMRTVRTTAESFTNSLEKNKLSLREYFRYAGASTKTFGKLFTAEFDTISKTAEDRVKKMQTQYIKMGRDASGAMKAIAVIPDKLNLDDHSTRLQLAAQRQQIFNQLVKQGSTNLLNFGKNTQWAGRQLMVGFTLPLATLGSTASKVFMDMETAAIKFRKVYGDLFTPKEETQAALDNITELGRVYTKYGIAVSKTVSLAAEAAAAGFQGLDLQRQTEQATRLSILGQIDQQKALETTISLQNAFRMSSEDLASSIDFLNAVENQTVTSLDDVTTAIPKAAPVIQQLGGDVKDLAFLLTAMREGGINASEGANALKSGLASIINPTSKASDMLATMGINIDKIVESNRGNLKATVIEFATAMNQLDPLSRARAIEQLFGKFQFARISTLLQNVTQTGNQASRVLELAGSSVEDLANLSSQELGITAESAMNKFKGAVEDLRFALVPLGETFLTVITPVIDGITGILDKFNSLSDGTKKVIAGIALVLGGIGPIALMTFGLLANGLANIVKGGLFLRNTFLRLTGQTKILGDSTEYLTIEQLQAEAAAASLDQAHARLTQRFTVEAGAVNELRNAYLSAISASEKFAFANPGMMIPGFKNKPKGFAEGGIIRGPGTGKSDSIVARLSNGEAVIPADSVARYPQVVNALVSGNIPGFAEGDTGSDRRSAFWTQSVRDRMRTSLGLSETQRVRIPLPIESKKYSVAGTLAPRSVNRESELGMTKEYLDSALGNAAFRANLRVGLEEFGSSMDRSAEVMQRIAPILDTAVSEFDDTIEGWQNASTRAMRQIESMPDLSDAEKAGLRRRLSPSQEDYIVPSTPMYEISSRKAKYRDERSTSAYNVRRQKQILRQQGFNREDLSALDFAHMPGYEKITGPVAPLQPPTIAGKTLTPQQISLVENTRDEYLRVRAQAENIGEQLVTSAAEGLRIGSEKALDIASPSKQMNNVGENAGKSLIAGTKSTVDDAKIVGVQLGDSVVKGVTQSAISRGPEVASAFPPRGRGSSRPAGPSPYQTFPGFGTSIRVPENATMLPIARQKSMQEIEAAYKKLGKEMDASRSIFKNLSPTITNTSFALSSLSGMLMMATNDSESKFAKFNDALFKASTALMSFSMISNMLPGGGMKGISGRFKKARSFGASASYITGSKAAVQAVKGGEFKSFRMARAAGAVANMGSKSPVSAISKFGPMIGRATLMVGRFLGPWGLAIGAVTAGYGIWKLINKAQEEARMKIEGLGDAATLTEDKLKTLGDIFGVVPGNTSSFGFDKPQAIVSSAQRTKIEELKANKDFKEKFGKDIEALKTASNQEIEIIMKSLGTRLLGAGFAPEMVSSIITAIQEEAGRTDFKLDLKSISLDEKGGVRNLEIATKQILSVFSDAFKDTTSNEFKKTARLASSAISGTMLGLVDQFKNGLISAEQLNGALLTMENQIKGLPQPQALMLMSNIMQLLPERLRKSASAIKDVSTQMLILKGQALGVAGAAAAIDAALALEKGGMAPTEAGAATKRLEAYKKAVANAIKEFQKIIQEGLTTPGTDPGGGTPGSKELSALQKAVIKRYEQEVKALQKKRDALKEVNEEAKRQYELDQKQNALTQQITEAKISGNYIQVALLKQEQAFNQSEYDRQTKELELDKRIAEIENRIQAINNGARVTAAEAALANIGAKGKSKTTSKTPSSSNTPSPPPSPKPGPVAGPTKYWENYGKKQKELWKNKGITPTPVAGTGTNPAPAVVPQVKQNGSGTSLPKYSALSPGLKEGAKFTLQPSGITYTLRKQGGSWMWVPDSGAPLQSVSATFANGGIIKGPGTRKSDSIAAFVSSAPGFKDGALPIRVSAGEYIVNAASTSMHKGVLDSINNGTYNPNPSSTVYNSYNIDVSGVQDPKMAADLVMRKLQLVNNKNNTSNKVESGRGAWS